MIRVPVKEIKKGNPQKFLCLFRFGWGLRLHRVKKRIIQTPIFLGIGYQSIFLIIYYATIVSALDSRALTPATTIPGEPVKRENDS